MSDPALLEAYRKQLRAGFASPRLIFMLWQEQPGIDREDLIDELKKVQAENDKEVTG